ncbi:MAG: hypothetical protein ACXACA_06250 [Candidatus Ranarchaeia archaeon]|jgi:hypothetical protein
MPREINIMDEQWNYLIVLDACRYDYFSNLFDGFFQGKLEKAYSPASCTLEWCIKSYPKYYEDVVYVSANPYINSKARVRGFKASDHFFRVIDVWEWGWNEQLGTVHPQKINEITMNLKDKYPEKRLIIHYLQPHAPYMSYDLGNGFPKPHAKGPILTGIQDKKPNRIRKLLRPINYLVQKYSSLESLFGNRPSWTIKEFLNIPASGPMEVVLRKVGIEGLRQAYEDNLKMVLSYVTRLVETLSGVIIVTADHGELLGEKRSYSHGCGNKNLLLKEVPWLVIEKEEKSRKISEKNWITRKVTQIKTSKRI